MGAARASLALLLAPLAACRALRDDDAWSFPVTRECLRALDEYEPAPPDEGKTWTCHENDDLWILAVILVGPLVVDIVILPVTAAHDLARS